MSVLYCFTKNWGQKIRGTSGQKSVAQRLLLYVCPNLIIFLANIQAALGGRVNQPVVAKRINQADTVSETFKNVEEMLNRLKLSNNDVDISISDISKYRQLSK